MKKLFLIDGNSFCYRAFYAIRVLSTSQGQPTNAIYGVTTMLMKLIQDEKPDYLAVAFDLKGPTFRHERYQQYKAHRKPMPDDLVGQMPIIKKVISAYRIPIFEQKGYEADDILATISKKAEKEKLDTFIVTGDKDALQLVSPFIKVYNPQKGGCIFDEEMVKATYGISPSQITDLMAIMGDASDNIPGVPGIGEKGARELMIEFGSLENLMKNVDKVKSVSKKKLIQEHKDSAFLSKELATVVTDIPIDVDFSELVLKGPDTKELMQIFKELEFTKLLKELAPSDEVGGEYVLIDTKKKMDDVLHILREQKEFVLDFETTHEDPMRAEPVGISLCWSDDKAYYIPFNLKTELTAEKVLSNMRDILEDKNIKKIGQNIKYEYIVLSNIDIRLEGIYFDTMVASYVINPSKMTHNLGDLSIEYLNHRMTPIQDLIGKGKEAITMDMVDVNKVMKYSCDDSYITYRLKKIFEKELKKKGLEKLFYNIEMPLCEVLACMEIEGVSIDAHYLSGLSEEMGHKLDIYRKKIHELAGEEFNINSPKQLKQILFDKMKLPIVKRTKTGPSTDEEVLRTLAEKNILPRELLKYRVFSKLKSTYVDALPELINPKTARIHTSFNQAVTQTGRLSSSKPNLQNIPIRTEEGRKIRRAFLPVGKADILLSADYSQIELRVMAHVSKDSYLIKAFTEGRDIHKFTASLVYNVDEKDVTDRMRSSAKTVNFGIIYGMGPFRLSKDLGIPINEAKEFIDNYFERYSGVKKYLDDTLKEVRDKKYVKTIMHRIRYIPEILSENSRVRSFAERTAINTPIQGSAADIIKMAMINIYRKMRSMKSRMIMQVHDELVFNVAKPEVKDVISIVREDMENVVKLRVPLGVNMKIGKNWLDLERYEL